MTVITNRRAGKIVASILDQVLTETQEVVVTREELAAQGGQAGWRNRCFQ